MAEDKKPLQEFELEESNVEFKSKTSGGRGDRCLLCCLFFGLLILLVFGAGITAFGLLYYRVFISDELVVLEAKLVQLEMQLNQSQAAVSSLQAQVSSPQVMSQISSATTGAQNISQELLLSRERSSTFIAGLFDQVRMNLTQEIGKHNGTSESQLARTNVLYSNSFQYIEDNLQSNNTQKSAQFVSDTQSKRNSTLDVFAQQAVNFTSGLLSLLGDGTRSTYVRWGSSSCPDIIGTTLVYSGYLGGSSFGSQGGGHNQVCMPMDPDTGTLRTETGTQDFSRMFGGEYAGTPQHDKNVPCAVCSVTIGADALMIPAKNSCPSGWTMEYDGYLMSEGPNNFRSAYICVDRSLEGVPGTSEHATATDLFLCRADCNENSLFCPPYTSAGVIGCVVCSK